MSDSKSSYGEPVEEPTPVDDVVGRVDEGLADAEAAKRDAVSEPAPSCRARADEPSSPRRHPSRARVRAPASSGLRRRRPRGVHRPRPAYQAAYDDARRPRPRRRARSSTPSEPAVRGPAVRRSGGRRRAGRPAAHLRPGPRGAEPAWQPRRCRRDRPRRRAVLRGALPRRVAGLRPARPATSRSTTSARSRSARSGPGRSG